MNKTELTDAVASQAQLPKNKAAAALEALLQTITDAMQREETVTLIGFGSFTVRKRAARKGRHPRTGKAIKIAATKVPVFRPGKELKQAAKESA
jgi:DNA-binding protein HU-beta